MARGAAIQAAIRVWGASTYRDASPEEIFTAGVNTLLADYETGLRAQGSTLVKDTPTWEDFRRQAAAVLAECALSLRGGGRGRGGAQSPAVSAAVPIPHHGVQMTELLRAGDLLKELTVRLLRGAVAGSQDPLGLMTEAVLALDRAVAAGEQRMARSYDVLLSDRIEWADLAYRRRIARDIHDHVGNGASLVHRHLELYDVLHSQDAATAHHKVTQARGVVTELLESIRRLVSDMRVQLPSARVGEAVKCFVESMDLLETSVDLQIEGDERWIPDEVGSEVFMVIRECLRNAFKHAHASRVTVRIEASRDDVRVEVQDDGRGFDTTSPKDGHGLASMAERVDALGGELAVLSRPGVGTRVQMSVPLMEALYEQAG
ncbi:sensor histidine kinase [Streptomyces polygonati]|uniref:Oxygen sensor histidine kinase NreB n=1 Tax=Streptomyces polygonati TaxID=1617087 RepID=A0ABV8HL98_9ACTN